MSNLHGTDKIIRRKFYINGIVQGVGFRPFIYRIANENKLAGFVNNDSQGVIIEVEGLSDNIENFENLLESDLPPLAKIDFINIEDIKIKNDKNFIIKTSQADKTANTLISPDIATCDKCLKELFNPDDRRYQYPFINCTNCGPRYTIIDSIPYDRPFTSMKIFPMCETCSKEYNDPADRRFHAQPNACHDCGPKIYLHDGNSYTNSKNPIGDAIKKLKEGKIVAVRGVGGFHLAVDAKNDNAVKLLRKRKQREEKPLAIMAKDTATISKYCDINKQEIELLKHHSRPIVLLRKSDSENDLSNNLALNNSYYGFMLPYTPLHFLLLSEHFDTLVMTSGNLSDEPIAISNDDAINRLKNIADIFLLHDREILERCDDSIVRVASNQNQIIRRARGYVPEPIRLSVNFKKNILAVGTELKNCIALGRNNNLFLSQHIGDLDNPLALGFFENSISHLKNLLQIEPEIIACDVHPEYLSTKYAHAQKLPTIEIQHHHAHMASVMAENNYFDPVIGIILDGTGYGTDYTIWGGEILYGDTKEFGRYAHLQQTRMPGGTQAIKHPWRMALSYLYNIYQNDLIDMEFDFLKDISKLKIETTIQMIAKKLNSPITSSCGRLFDSVAAILNICNEAKYEAQPAIALEMTASRKYKKLEQNLQSITTDQFSGGEIKLNKLILDVLNMLSQNKPVEQIAAVFHVNLAELLINSILSLREKQNINTVALSGGVYQNLLFFEYMFKRLSDEKFKILTHRNVPTNDGGIALGQAVIANSII